MINIIHAKFVGVRVDFPEISVINRRLLPRLPPHRGLAIEPAFASFDATECWFCELILLTDMAACTRGLTRHSKTQEKPVPLMSPLIRRITNSLSTK